MLPESGVQHTPARRGGGGRRGGFFSILDFLKIKISFLDLTFENLQKWTPVALSLGDRGLSPDHRATGPLSPSGRATGWLRSEERRVGKEWRARWSPCHRKKKKSTRET